MKRALVIGGGFAGLSAASFLARRGMAVELVEQHPQLGGRARQFQREGFTFDMGPSWYWMPEVFERYFAAFGESVADHYELVQLDPAYSIVWPGGSKTGIPASWEGILEMAESLETGAATQLQRFMKEAAFKYEVGMRRLVYKPSRSVLEFAGWDVLRGVLRLQLFRSIASHVRQYFRDERLIQLMEFPVLFLGALPADTPALYSLMNHASLKLGTWYPMGGMHRIVQGMAAVADNQGVRLATGEAVTGFDLQGGRIRAVETSQRRIEPDVVVAGADYHHIEAALLPERARSYSEAYWNRRTMAPTALLYYVGLRGRLPELNHHTLFFDAPFDEHAEAIYRSPAWPGRPLFYVCCPSRTDPSVAPEGHENLFLLIPLSVELADDEAVRERYFQHLLGRLEEHLGRSIRQDILFHQSYARSDFMADYNAFKGNAYGLANTLFQTAFFKPRLRSKRVRNLYYTGQLTVPGPGVPPSLISGEVVAREAARRFA